jgi:hypothetical protein
MRLVILFIFALIVPAGCSSFKKDVGDYVKDAVVQQVEADIDTRLASHDLSIAEIKSMIVVSSDGRFTAKDMITTAKDLVKDFVALEAQKIIDDKIEKAKANLVTSDQLETHKGKFWNWLLVSFGGVLVPFVGKFVHSLSQEKGFRDRLTVLEGLLGQKFEQK